MVWSRADPAGVALLSAEVSTDLAEPRPGRVAAGLASACISGLALPRRTPGVAAEGGRSLRPARGPPDGPQPKHGSRGRRLDEISKSTRVPPQSVVACAQIDWRAGS